MPRKNPRVKVDGELNLYIAGDVFYACATPPGERQAQWLTIGAVGIMHARRARDTFVGQVRSGQHDERARTNASLTFTEAYEQWITHRHALRDVGELAPRTVEINETAWRLYLKKALGRRRVSALRPEDLVAWHQTQRLLGHSPWTIKQRWTVITGVLQHAARHHGIPNVADMLETRERPKAGQTRVRFLTDDELRRLLGATKPLYRPAIATAAFTGVRLSELLGLTWDDIDFDEEVIHVRFQMPRGRNPERRRLKTPASIRDVILVPALAAELRRHRMAIAHSQGHDLLFATASGKTVGHRNLTARGLDKAVALAELKDISLHVLRHTFASILIDQGRDVPFVAKQLGHNDPAFTLRTYVHLFNAARQSREARDQFDARYGHLLAVPGTSTETSA